MVTNRESAFHAAGRAEQVLTHAGMKVTQTSASADGRYALITVFNQNYKAERPTFPQIVRGPEKPAADPSTAADSSAAEPAPQSA